MALRARVLAVLALLGLAGVAGLVVLTQGSVCGPPPTWVWGVHSFCGLGADRMMQSHCGSW